MMADTQIRFEDGLSYERYMGDWSRRVGIVFLDWLAAPSGLKWIDVGCGNGAHRTPRSKVRTHRGYRNRSIGGPTRLCAQTVRRASGKVRPWGRHGPSRQILSMSRQWHW